MITATLGSRIYVESCLLIFSATSAGVRPPASTSPMSGNEIFPSGLTGAVMDNSGLRHTVTCTRSSTPMRYSSTFANGRSALSTGAGTLSQPATSSATTVIPTHPNLFIYHLATHEAPLLPRLGFPLLSRSREPESGQAPVYRAYLSRCFGSPENDFAAKNSIFRPLVPH